MSTRRWSAVGVYRGHQSFLDAKLVVQDFDNRCQAVRGTRGS